MSIKVGDALPDVKLKEMGEGGPKDVSIGELTKGKKVVFFAVGVEGANMKLLSKISVRQPLKLKGLRFVDMFVWLSKSTERIAHSREGEQVALPPVDWGSIIT